MDGLCHSHCPLAKLLLNDTDSLCLKTEDIHVYKASDAQSFDFSEYPTHHLLYNNDNKKVIGKFKDET